MFNIRVYLRLRVVYPYIFMSKVCFKFNCFYAFVSQDIKRFVMYFRKKGVNTLSSHIYVPMLSLWKGSFWHFATFNVADIATTLGATLLVFINLFQKDEEPEKAKPKVLSVIYKLIIKCFESQNSSLA